ncbi:MAG: tyrosine-type recombinase/integrase, partial [Paraglaciecola sp.]
GLDATPESIKAISSKMIAKALDEAQLSKVKRHYEFLFYGVVFWLSLSKDGYLPKDLALSGISLGKVDTKKRRQSVARNAIRYVNGWKPLSEPDLATLLSYAVDWIEKGLPLLESIKIELINAKVWDERNIFVSSKDKFDEYIALFSSKVNGNEIVQTSFYTHENRKPGKEDYGWQIHWKHGFRLALNEVKNSLLVSLDLITGMRIRELSELTYDDFTYDEDSDKWFLDITRFKTSDDPNYQGETDTIEIPHFYGENFKKYKSLRDAIVDDDSEVLFDNNLSRSANKVKRSINKVFKKLGEQLGIDDLHPHRLRKTIAEILIKRSEKNIDIIRMLFGHRSFTMTLRYISRNPFMLGSVAATLETHYADNFNEIIAAAMEGEASGQFVSQLEEKFISEKNQVFKGKLIRMKVFEYIIYLLQSGVPLHIERTTLGSFCVLANAIDPEKIPPCIQGRDSIGGLVPDISNCDVSCEHAVVLKHSVESLKKDILFYEAILENSISELSAKSKREIVRKIESNKNHLSKFSPDENYREVSIA